jgi:hypothetical protein
MRDFVFVCVVVLIAAGGILLWQSHIDPFHPSKFQSEPATAPVKASRPGPADTPRAAKLRHITKSVPALVAEESLVVEGAPVREIPPPTPVVAPDPPPFPAADQIAMGVHQDAVTTAYGDPAISAATVMDGHMVETLVYARDRQPSATVIRVVDGKVSSAYTKAGPPPARGRLVPRHLQSK